MTDINVKHKAISQNKASICSIQINPKTNVFSMLICILCISQEQLIVALITKPCCSKHWFARGNKRKPYDRKSWYE